MREIDKALFKAVEANNLEDVKETLNKGANVNARDEFGRTPLDIAKAKRYTEIAKLLKQAMGIKPEDKALFEAVKANNLLAVKKALKAGADVNARDEFDRKPFYYAGLNKNSVIGKILIEEVKRVLSMEKSPTFKLKR